MYDKNSFFNILCLSGGGVRGIFQAVFLEKLEEYLNEKYKKKLSDVFNVVAGTSTGAIIASAVAMDVPPRSVSNIYREKASVIFKKNIKSYFYAGGRYKQEPLKNELSKIFSSKQLKDAKTELIITATCIDMYSSQIFSSTKQSDMFLVDAILSSTAAPTYFKAVKPVNQERSYVDGGMWGNAPSLAAYNYVRNLYPHIPNEHIRIFTIGNGNYSVGIPIQKYNSRRTLDLSNVKTVLDLLFMSQEDYSNKVISDFIDKDNLIMINTSLSQKIALDDTIKANTILPPLAEKTFEDNYKDIDSFFSSTPKNQTYSINNLLAHSITKAGLSAFVPTRDDYKDFRRGHHNISSYIETAQKNVTLISVSLATGVEFEALATKIKDMIENKKVAFVISLLNPDNNALMESVAPIFAYSTKELSRKIKNSLKNIHNMKKTLSMDNQKKIDIRVHNTLPFGSAIMLDCEEDGTTYGRIQIETKPYKVEYNGSFAFEITNHTTNKLFSNLYMGCNLLLADGREWVPTEDIDM